MLPDGRDMVARRQARDGYGPGPPGALGLAPIFTRSNSASSRARLHCRFEARLILQPFEAVFRQECIAQLLSFAPSSFKPDLLMAPNAVLAVGPGQWTAARAARRATRTRSAAGHRARSHCRVVLPLIRFISDSLTYSVPLFLKRRCDRTPGGAGSGGLAQGEEPLPAGDLRARCI